MQSADEYAESLARSDSLALGIASGIVGVIMGTAGFLLALAGIIAFFAFIIALGIHLAPLI